ncbi:MAG: hypothetical protein AB1589_36995, partial [Cyanobacteriota bacterium]
MTRSKKNLTQEIADALNTTPDLDWQETADSLDLSVPQLQERMASRLGDIVFAWELIPSEHGPVIEAIERDLEAESSVRRLTEATEPPIEQAQEPPMLEEEPQPKKRGGRKKKESTALTKKKAEALKTSDQKSQQLAASDQEVKVRLHARKGQKSGAQLATIELAAEDLTYRKVKGEALLRKTGQLISEISGSADIDPVQVLSELGLDTNDEIFDALRTQIEPALGKLETATGEIVANRHLRKCSKAFIDRLLAGQMPPASLNAFNDLLGLQTVGEQKL